LIRAMSITDKNPNQHTGTAGDGRAQKQHQCIQSALLSRRLYSESARHQVLE
jgi:hypothetical protein